MLEGLDGPVLTSDGQPGAAVPEAPAAVLLPIVVLGAGLVVAALRRRTAKSLR